MYKKSETSIHIFQAYNFFCMEFADINYLAVIVAAVAAFALGALWYSPVLFSKPWQELVGLTDEKIKSANMAVTMGGSFVLIVLMSFGLAVILNNYPEAVDWLASLYTGLFVGILFAATSMGINMLYQQKPLKLFLIDAGYQVLFLTLMGIILGLWR